MTEEINPYKYKDEVFRRLIRRHQMRAKDLDRDFEDLFQNAVIKTWKTGKKFNSKKGLVCYLSDAVKTAKIDCYRKDRALSIASPSLAKKDRVYTVEILDFIRDTKADTAFPDRDYDIIQRRDLLFDLVVSLPEKLKSAVILYFYRDKTYNEVGDLMNCSAKQARRYVEYAIKILKDKSEYIKQNCNFFEKEHKPLPYKPVKNRKEKKIGEHDDYSEESMP